MRKKHFVSAILKTRSPHSLAKMCLLGSLCGLATSIVMAWFVITLDLALGLFNEAEQGFASLNKSVRFFLPIIGALLLIVLYRLCSKCVHELGVVHVLARLHTAKVRLPFANALFQVVAAFIVLVFGFSMGKEGPAVHLGATLGTQLGAQTKAPPYQLRLLGGCGVAAAISAAFGTPLAGIMFAMEIVLMKYSLAGLIPIMASAVTAQVSLQFFLPEYLTFWQITIPSFVLADLPFVLLLGVICGLVATTLHLLIKQFLALKLARIEVRFLIAALVTGLIGLWVPQVLGLGFDTMNTILTGNHEASLLAIILLSKIMATAIAVGMGMPGGIIAPSLFIGLTSGTLLAALLPAEQQGVFYAFLDMAGVMSALLHAPLAALTAILELTLTAELLFPAMLVIVIANLTCQVFFAQPSIFQTLLIHKGMGISNDSADNALASRFLTEIGQTNIFEVQKNTSLTSLKANLEHTQAYVILPLAHCSGFAYLCEPRVVSKKLRHFSQQTSVYDFLITQAESYQHIVVLPADASLLTGLNIFLDQKITGIQVRESKCEPVLILRDDLLQAANSIHQRI